MAQNAGTNMEARQWQKGAVKRLASVYEGIAHATSRNADLITDVSKALKDSALSLRHHRNSSSSSTWSSRQSSLKSDPASAVDPESVSATNKITSPAPATEVLLQKVRAPSPGPASTSVSVDTATATGFLGPEQTWTLPPLAPLSPLKALPVSMPPTPPASPPNARTEWIRQLDALSDLDDHFSISTDNPAAHSMLFQQSLQRRESGARSSARKRSLSPPFSPDKTQSISSAKRQSTYPLGPDIMSSSDTILCRESPLLLPSVPKIKLRDFDSDDRSREVSFTSTASTHPSSHVTLDSTLYTNSTNTADSRYETVHHEFNTHDRDELIAFLEPMRTKALQALEEDTSTLVDALRSFVNELRRMSAELERLREGKCKGKDQGRAHELCTAARRELREMKRLISALKEPREEALKLAEIGPGSGTGFEVHDGDGENWTHMADRVKVEVVRAQISKGQTSPSTREVDKTSKKTESLERVLTAVVEQEANKEFLGKVKGWEEGVATLEREFGVLFV